MIVEAGFVLGVLVAGLLLVDRLGGTEELARRLFQAAIGISLALAVLSFTNAFVLSPGAAGDDLVTSNFSESSPANRLAFASAVHAGAGIIALLFGIGGLSKWTTTPLGIAAGGVILLLLSEPSVLDYFARGAVGADRGPLIVYFVVQATGFGALVWFARQRWDIVDAESSLEDADPHPEPDESDGA